jgi:hypothetical protein
MTNVLVFYRKYPVKLDDDDVDDEWSIYKAGKS